MRMAIVFYGETLKWEKQEKFQDSLFLLARDGRHSVGVDYRDALFSKYADTLCSNNKILRRHFCCVGLKDFWFI